MNSKEQAANLSDEGRGDMRDELGVLRDELGVYEGRANLLFSSTVVSMDLIAISMSDK